MKKKMTELLREEALRFNNVVYFSKPYCCCIDECLSHFKGYDAPEPENMTIERTEKETTIAIKPLKGSGKRKLYVIKLWVS
jgi:hypothetical protein